MRRLVFRREGFHIHISAPLRTSKTSIIAAFNRVYPRLMKVMPLEHAWDETHVLWLGEKVNYQSLPFKDLTSFYDHTRQQLADLMRPRLDYYAQHLNLNVPTFSIRKMKTRWGTYAMHRHHITLAAQLIHFPAYVIEAVLVHELVHAIHPNHSRQFYTLLNKTYPLYEMAYAKLKPYAR